MRARPDARHGGFNPLRLAIAAVMLAAAVPAQAQYLEGPRGYDRAPPPGYGDRDFDRGYRPPPRDIEREPVGLNCAAVQQGFTGPRPYSCPLPGPRPLGVRCFCNLPIAAFSPPQTAVGRVVR